MRKQRIVLCGIAALSLTPYTAAADETAKPAETEKEAAKASGKKATDKTVQLEAIKIIADSPVGDSGVEEYKLPSHVQTIDAEQLDQAESVTLPDYMNRFLGSVNVNDAQNNPFQPDSRLILSMAPSGMRSQFTVSPKGSLKRIPLT